MAAAAKTGVPIIRETTVREHIPLSYAGGPSEWVLINIGNGKCVVAETYENYAGAEVSYDLAHGPFRFDELTVGLAKVAKRKARVSSRGLDYPDDDDEAEKIGAVLYETSSMDPRVAVRTGEDEVTIVAPCGEAHIFVLSKLREVVRAARKLSVCETG